MWTNVDLKLSLKLVGNWWLALGTYEGENCKYNRNHSCNLYAAWLYSQTVIRFMINFISYVFYT